MKDKYDNADDMFKDYHKEHKVCPECGSVVNKTTLVGYNIDVNAPLEFKDLNVTICAKCGYRCSRHDRISKKEFIEKYNKRNFPYFTGNFSDPKNECKKAYELLRRVYDIIEDSHLNDHKLIPEYCQKFSISRNLGESIYNLLYSKDQIFRCTTIKRQIRYIRKYKK